MARIVLVVAIVTLLFFVVLTVRVCQFSLSRRRIPEAQRRRSKYQRLIRRARHCTCTRGGSLPPASLAW
jgi:hypothetical protein